MKRFQRFALLLFVSGHAAFGAAAHAASLELAADTRARVQVGVGELGLGGLNWSLRASNAALGVSAQAVAGLGPLGFGTLQGGLDYGLRSGGLRVTGEGSGSVGPVALSLAGRIWTAPQQEFSALGAYALRPEDLRAAGWQASAGARYRLSRDLLLTGEGELGGENLGELRGELRREGGTVGVGVLAGQRVLGAGAGLSLAGERTDLSAWAYASSSGPGGRVEATLYDALTPESTLGAYLAYEPWRAHTLPLRYGADLVQPLLAGTLHVGLRGGDGLAGRVAYRLPLLR